MQLPHSYQVLTGVLPFDGINDYNAVAFCIQFGERPLRPRNQDANQWLWDRVWDMITTCWSEDPKERWRITTMDKLFSILALPEVQNSNSGNLKHSKHQKCQLKTPENTGRQQLVGVHLLQILEPEIERLIDEMDKASPSTFSTLLRG